MELSNSMFYIQVNPQNSDGNSPLHITCQADHEHRLHIILKLLKVCLDNILYAIRGIVKEEYLMIILG